MTKPDTIIANERAARRIANGFKTLDATQRMVLSKEIYAAIAEAQKPVKMDLEECGYALLEARGYRMRALEKEAIWLAFPKNQILN